MASIALKTEPLEELKLLAEPAPDRLPAMLFLAALVHGILIIGVTFNPAMLDDFSDAISLEVTIVADPDQEIDRPDRAEYLAQASQEGGGNTMEQVRPSAPPENSSPVDNPGDEFGDSFLESTEHEVSADQLLATATDQENAVTDDPRIEPQPDTSSALALEAGSEATLPLPQEDRATLLIHDDDPRQLVISADTRESVVAAYLDTTRTDNSTRSSSANRAVRACSTRRHSTYCGAHRRSIRFRSKSVPNTTVCASPTSGCSARNLSRPRRASRSSNSDGRMLRLYGPSSGRILSVWTPPKRWPISC
jgi:hypothetical protein